MIRADINKTARVIPLVWLHLPEVESFINDDCIVIPIQGYHPVKRCKAYKIIGQDDNNYISTMYNQKIWLWNNMSIDIHEDWKLTAEYAAKAEYIAGAGIQMFRHLPDDEKLLALKNNWIDIIEIIADIRSNPNLFKMYKIHSPAEFAKYLQSK